MFCPKCSKENGDADKFCWNCGNNLAGAEIEIPAAPVSPAPPEFPEQNDGTDPVTGYPRARRVPAPRGFILGSLGAGFGLAILLAAAAVYMVFFREAEPLSLTVIIPGAAALALLVYGAAVKLLLVYRMWDSLRDRQARMAPAPAAALLLVPAFNIFWLFPVFRGFAADYNDFAARSGYSLAPLSGGLFLAYPLLNLATWIPYGAFLAGAHFFGFPAVDLGEWWVSAAGLLVAAVNCAVLVLLAAKICRAVNDMAVLPDGAPGFHGPVFPPETPYEVSYGDPQVAVPVQQPAAKPVLVGISGLYAGKMIEIEGTLVIGRDPWSAQLVYPPDNSEISRRHCSVYYDQARQCFVLEDHSSNGTFVAPHEEALVPGSPRLLNPGDRFFLADRQEVFEVALEV